MSRPSFRTRSMAKRRKAGVTWRIAFGENAAGRTELSLICTDRPGLLAMVSAVFRNRRLRVNDARIATFGERVEDFFQLTDEADRPLDAAAQEALRAALVDALDPPAKDSE